MNKDLQRIAIAEACGWKPEKVSYGTCWTRSTLPLCYAKRPESLPDYLGDLNAMHEAEKTLTLDQLSTYLTWLAYNVNRANGHLAFDWVRVHATADKRVEAFLRTLNLWVDTP